MKPKNRSCTRCSKPIPLTASNYNTRLFCSRACYYAGHRPTKEEQVAAFWAKVHKGERCWIWQGAKHFRGYGACAKTYGDCRAHRVSWLLTNGPIPKGQGVLHKCDTPLCVNPEHLYLGDQKRNSADRVARGRKGNRYQPVETLLHPHLSRRGKLSKEKHV